MENKEIYNIQTLQIRNHQVLMYNTSLLHYTGTKETLNQSLKTNFDERMKVLYNTEKEIDLNEWYEEYHQLYKLKAASFPFDIKELGTFSKTQVKRIKKIIQNLVQTILINYKKSLNYKDNPYITFLTLTLPSTQKHSDKILKRKCIHLLENLKKTYKLSTYIWKAEAQKNGNIHFHVILDRWISYKSIQKIWNGYMVKLGYINKGDDPNTIKIHSIKNIKNIHAYLIKYFTKNEEEKRPIIGRLWGCTNNIKSFTYPVYNESQILIDNIMTYLEQFFDKQYYTQCISFEVDINKLLRKYIRLDRFYRHHYNTYYKILYEP